MEYELEYEFFVRPYIKIPPIKPANESHLSHHGVKGQQWGVQNGPPYPIDRKVMKKGTKLKSVIEVNNFDNKVKNKLFTKGLIDANGKVQKIPIYTYSKDDEWDNKVYKGPFSKYLVERSMFEDGTNNTLIAELDLETIKDLTMPTREERIAEFKNLYNDTSHRFLQKSNHDNFVKELTMMRDHMVTRNINPKIKAEIKDIDFKNLKTDADYEAAYKVFNHLAEAAYAYKSTSKYFENMSKKYDAMVDDNNQGIYNNAHDPVIIFDMTQSLKRNGSKVISEKEILDNIDYVRKELEKMGLNLAF